MIYSVFFTMKDVHFLWIVLCTIVYWLCFTLSVPLPLNHWTTLLIHTTPLKWLLITILTIHPYPVLTFDQDCVISKVWNQALFSSMSSAEQVTLRAAWVTRCSIGYANVLTFSEELHSETRTVGVLWKPRAMLQFLIKPKCSVCQPHRLAEMSLRTPMGGEEQCVTLAMLHPVLLAG